MRNYTVTCGAAEVFRSFCSLAHAVDTAVAAAKAGGQRALIWRSQSQKRSGVRTAKLAARVNPDGKVEWVNEQ